MDLTFTIKNIKTYLTLFFIFSFSMLSIAQPTISYGDNWNYIDDGVDPGVSWNMPSYNDAAWLNGNGEFGFGDGVETTLLTSGSVVYYLRKNFTVASAASVSSATLNFVRDDGVVIYINGTEVSRSNVPLGVVTNTTTANSNITGVSENSVQNAPIPLNLLLDGNNLIAVSLHNRTNTNPDLSFDLEMNLAVQACSVPTGIASSTLFNEANIEWDSDPTASSFDVRYRIFGSPTWTNVSSATNAAQLESLGMCQSYEYQVAAFCGALTSYSSSNFFTTECTASPNNVKIPAGSDWKYYQLGNEPPGNWDNEPYNDVSWPSGPGELGFGDGDESTLLNSGLTTYYFRKNFYIQNPSAYPTYTLRYKRDDGIIIKLNGLEIVKENLPNGSVNYSTLANATISNEDDWIEVVLNASDLNSGDNVLTAEVHQRALTSSDISFDLSLEGTLLEVTRGPYLQQGGSDRMTVKWRTSGPAESIVNYGTTFGNYTMTASDLVLKTNHELEITGLDPSTKYYYEIQHNGDILFEGTNDLYFQTYPVAGSQQSYTTWVLGDCGTANNNARAVRDRMYSYLGSDHLDMMLFLGDNAYNDGTDAQYQNAIFQNMYEDRLKNTVSWSCLGNHDGYTADSNTQTGPYYEIFDFPTSGECGGIASGTEAYYSFDHGNTHYIVLDSYETNRGVGNAMYNWAQMDIQNTTAEWIVAVWHHPPYTKGTHNSDTEGLLIDMRQNFLPMLESNGVDLVLGGHSHGYERSYLLNGHYGFSSSLTDEMILDNCSGKEDVDNAYIIDEAGPNEDKGTVYIVTGNAGKQGNGQYNHPAMYISEMIMGSMVIETTGDEMFLQHIDINGNIHDYFTIRKDPVTACVQVPSGLNGQFLAANNNVNLSWNAIAEAVSYDVRYREIGAANWTETSVNGTSLDISGPSLQCNVNYEFQVKAICECRYSDFSGSSIFNSSTACVVCSDIAATSASTIGANSATLNWTSSSSAINYLVEYRIMGQATWQSSAVSALNLALTGLTPCTTYEYRITPNCSFGISANTENGTFDTACCNDIVTGLSASNLNMNLGAVSWNPIAGAIGYEIDFKESTETLWNTASRTSPTIAFFSLNTCSTYDVRVRVICAGSVVGANSSIFTFSSDCQGCLAPTGLAAINVGETFALISWSDVLGANSYAANYREVGTPTWIPVTVSSSSLSLSSLQSCKTYELYVSAECAVLDISPASQIINFSTECCNTAPASLAVSNISPNQAQLSWGAVTGASFYNLEYKPLSSSTWTAISVITNNYTLTGLNLCDFYNVRVNAGCPNGSISAFSNVSNFASACISVPCDSPQITSISALSTESAEVLWNLEPTALSYDLVIRPTGGSIWDTIAVAATDTSYIFNDLYPCISYQYAMISLCQQNVLSTMSPIQTFVQPCCDSVQNMPTLTGISSNSVSIAYDSFPSITSYQVRHRLIGSAVWITNLTANDNITLNGILACEEYEMQVASICGTDTTAFSPILKFLGECCNAPFGINVTTSLGNSNAIISWVAINGASDYRVEYREVGQVNWLLTNTTSPNAFLVGLTSCADYELQITSTCPLNPGAANTSLIRTFTTGNCTNCTPPAGLFSFNKTNNSAIVTWDVLVSASSYSIRFRELGSATWNLVYTTVFPITVLTGLQGCQYYEYQISNNCTPLETSSWSISHVFNTVNCKTEEDSEISLADYLLSMVLYPNPTSGILNVEGIDNIENVEIQWLSANGETFDLELKNSAYDLSHLNSGIYIMLIRSGDSIETRKITLVK